MRYTAVYFRPEKPSDLMNELMIAELNDAGFEGFMETDHGVVGYLSSELYEKTDVNKLQFMQNSELGRIEIETEFVVDKNWNELWESNYKPAVISEEIIVRAPFHNTEATYKYDIIIEPKMSFGTGHHETTSLMIKLISKINMQGKTVLDVGCGTGVLGILSAMMGAKSVTALDINEWAYENTIENAKKNNVENIYVSLGGIDTVGDQFFDILLANITRNVLLAEIPTYSHFLVKGGILLLSGFLNSDLAKISEQCKINYLSSDSHVQKKDWIAAKFKKN